MIPPQTQGIRTELRQVAEDASAAGSSEELIPFVEEPLTEIEGRIGDLEQQVGLGLQTEKTEDELLRKELAAALVGAKYVPASQYRAKHVKGKTNEERRKNSMEGGAGQYLAELNGVAVTDATITEWERRAMARAVAGEGVVDRRQSGYHVYIDHGFVVGYAGGEEVSAGRVELSGKAGEIHSHPRAI